MNHEYDPNQPPNHYAPNQQQPYGAPNQQQPMPGQYPPPHGGYAPQGQYPPPPGYPPPYGQLAPGAFGAWDADNSDSRMWAMLAHLGGLFFGFLAPLVVYLVKKDESPFIADQAREALNFQISLIIYIIAAFASIFVVIGILLLPAVGIFGLVVQIVAAIKSNSGIAYRYPLCIRFIQ